MRINAIALTFVIIATSDAQYTIFQSVYNLYRDGMGFLGDEKPDTERLYKEYDFIIIGAGTAGCILANRLTEVNDFNVLLIEAGGDENFVMDIPILASLLQLTPANWRYTTEPQESGCRGMKNGRCNWPRGKVVGGSSVLHSMMHTRGNRQDYDGWARDGNPGWDYESVLPYFKKSENIKIPDLANDKTYHSTKGEMDIVYAPYLTPLSAAFLDAGVETGGRVLDYNGEKQIGYSLIQFTIRDGQRLSTNKAFLHPIKNRNNFHIAKTAMVTKILIDPVSKAAYGVIFKKKNKYFTVRAKKEVILSAGAINSPQLLMLSGVGPKEHLQEHNIPVIVDLPVGYNLQDHQALGGLTFTINASISLRNEEVATLPNILKYFATHTGPVAAPSGTEALAFFDTKNPDDEDGYPDLELLFVAGSLVSTPAYKTVFGVNTNIWNKVYKPIEDRHTWMVFPMLLLPESKGRVMLGSNNPFAKPIIHANYFSDDGHDEQVVLKGIRKTIELSKTKAFQKYDSRLHDIPLPNCAKHKFSSDAYWICAMKTITTTIYHHTSTCRMGPPTDREAVVDPRLRVYGVSNLRVVDASIMPRVPAAHTNAPTMMIAEKAADMIKDDWLIYYAEDNNNL